MPLLVVNPLVAQLTHRPFPEVAEVLRTEAEAIRVASGAAVRDAMIAFVRSIRETQADGNS